MSLYTRHDLIFGHEGNARAATSVILIGVLAALIGSVFMAIGPRFEQEPRPTGDAYIGGHRRRFASSDMRRVRMGPASSRFGQILISAASCAGSHGEFRQYIFARAERQAFAAYAHGDKMDRQSSSQDATNGSVPYYATARAPLEQTCTTSQSRQT